MHQSPDAPFFKTAVVTATIDVLVHPLEYLKHIAILALKLRGTLEGCRDT